MSHICLPSITKLNSKRKLILAAAFLVFCSPSLLAADAESKPTNNSANESLQQQLQTLQQALNPSPSPKKTTTASANTNEAGIATTVVSEGIVDNNDEVDASAQSVDKPATALPASDDVEENGIRSQAFGQMISNSLPLSPSQIRMLHSMYDATQQAAASYPGIPPRPTASSLVVNLSPGATPPIVRLGAGFITSLVFVDSTGAPWPIDSYSLGNPAAFNIQWDKKSNILLMQAITAHRIGNLAVILKGLGTPVMVDLHPGQAALDVRVDLRIPGLGPQAKPAFDTLPGTESPALLALLDGIPPTGAKNLKSSACENCAWLVDKKMYLRTQFSVLSPAWISTLSSADGTHVYEMQLTPLVLASYHGKTIKMRIEGF